MEVVVAFLPRAEEVEFRLLVSVRTDDVTVTVVVEVLPCAIDRLAISLRGEWVRKDIPRRRSHGDLKKREAISRSVPPCGDLLDGCNSG